MYKVYLLKRRKGGSEVVKESRTNTPSAAAAEDAFWELRNRTDLAGQHYILLMTKDGQKLNVHNFMEQPGDVQYIALGDTLRMEAEEQ